MSQKTSLFKKLVPKKSEEPEAESIKGVEEEVSVDDLEPTRESLKKYFGIEWADSDPEAEKALAEVVPLTDEEVQKFKEITKKRQGE